MAKILVTGGAGYIGSTTCKLLNRSGHEVIVYDNLSTGHSELAKFGKLVIGDIRETSKLAEMMSAEKIEAVIHFAASAYVGESVTNPSFYYDNNVGGTLSLLKAMTEAGVSSIVVSSTCAVYGQPDRMPIDETTSLDPINPYGASKAMMERICWDFGTAYGIRAVALRYFNACGTEPELEVGERHDPEPHVIPRILMAADGVIDSFDIYGTDYPTADGTCIRDYIHVSDLASAHVRAYDYLAAGNSSFACNLGTGKGLSVRQILESAKRITNREITVLNKPRRPGDPAELVANPSQAYETLGWRAEHSDIETIMSSAWSWYRQEAQAREQVS
ncbi:UDP-glucose 4-epimerase GalE [Roseibium sp.]|uniref:UDP-glucose 4-epimerase GalE n=1 Tax=Roseibium sp. TaxID=1936156 RepID=UPI003A97129E